jgi:hypothetical protein
LYENEEVSPYDFFAEGATADLLAKALAPHWHVAAAMRPHFCPPIDISGNLCYCELATPPFCNLR